MYEQIEENLEQDRTALASISIIDGAGHYVSDILISDPDDSSLKASVDNLLTKGNDTAAGPET